MVTEIRTDINESAEQSLGHDLQQNMLNRILMSRYRFYIFSANRYRSLKLKTFLRILWSKLEITWQNFMVDQGDFLDPFNARWS